MRSAHQGIAPTPLLGLDNGGWLSAPPAPMTGPAAAAPAGQQNNQNNQQSNSGGLDFWLLDKLFGRQ
jgi:hypothetical protein